MATLCLVVGASGILGPAAATLAQLGNQVTGVSLSRPVPAGVEWLRFDAASPAEMHRALGDRSWDTAIVYEPAVSPESLAVLRRCVSGRLRLVQTSAAAAPELGDAFTQAPGTLMLGWHPGALGITRWHTPAEVSAAALQSLHEDRPTVLGRIRPWEARPA